MAKTEYTPGPWMVDEAGTSIGVGSGTTYKHICRTLWPGYPPTPEQFANALLIAAAPTMYSALFVPDANAEAERARQDFLRTHPELAAIKESD